MTELLQPWLLNRKRQGPPSVGTRLSCARLVPSLQNLGRQQSSPSFDKPQHPGGP